MTAVRPQTINTLEAQLSGYTYDFIDLGAGVGRSVAHYERATGLRGVGVELRESKVEEAKALGHPVVQGSVYDLPDNKLARFVTIDNVLEHLPTLDDVERALAAAQRVARDFIYIRHPGFDDDDYLESLGVRTYWANWSDHPSHIRLCDFAEIATRLGLGTWEVHPVGRIHDTDDPAIIPLSAPRNQHDYDAEKHGPKPHVTFDRPVYAAYDILFHLSGEPTVRLNYVAERTASITKPRFVHLAPAAAHTGQPSDSVEVDRRLATHVLIDDGKRTARRIYKKAYRTLRRAAKPVAKPVLARLKR